MQVTAQEADVRSKLLIVILATEVASLVLLAFLLYRKADPDPEGIVLLSLFPVFFGLHVAEEFVYPGGFISWDHVYRPRLAGTSAGFYVCVNAIPAIVLVLLVLALGLFNSTGFCSRAALHTWITLVALMAWNAVFHLRGALATRRYSPGMLTGLVLLLPLAAASCAHFLRAGIVGRYTMAECVAIALLIQPFLELVHRPRSAKTARA